MNTLWEEWLQKIGNKKFAQTWKRLSSKNPKSPFFKSYIHFSERITIEEISKMKDFLLDTKNIRNHSFNPLLSFLKKTPLFDRETVEWRRRDYRKLTSIGNKVRPLMYADHLDSVIYSWYAYILWSMYEERLRALWIQQYIAAYRNDRISRTNSSTAKEMFDFVRLQDPDKNYIIMLFDIQKFYDTLDPGILKKMWSSLFTEANLPEDHFAVYRSVIDYSVVNKNELSMYLNNRWVNIKNRKIGKLCTKKEFHDMRKDGLFMRKWKFLSYISPFINKDAPFEFENLTRDGTIIKWIPQWLPLSPVLANMYMLNFDFQMGEKVKEIGCFYRRYADDIWIVCEMGYEKELENFVINKIEELKLHIQTKKTQKYKYTNWGLIKLDSTKWDNQAFTYLGLTQRWDKGYIRNGTLAKWHQKIRIKVRQAFGKKKWGEDISAKQVYEDIIQMGLFNYIKLCAKDHGAHVYKQFSKKRLKAFVKKSLEKLDSYKKK